MRAQRAGRGGAKRRGEARSGAKRRGEARGGAKRRGEARGGAKRRVEARSGAKRRGEARGGTNAANGSVGCSSLAQQLVLESTELLTLRRAFESEVFPDARRAHTELCATKVAAHFGRGGMVHDHCDACPHCALALWRPDRRLAIVAHASGARLLQAELRGCNRGSGCGCGCGAAAGAAAAPSMAGAGCTRAWVVGW